MTIKPLLNFNNLADIPVTMDLSSVADEYETTSMNECLPESFCRWDTSAKKCVGKSPQEVAQPLSQAELDLTCGYAGQDITCPSGGCIGFQFTLPENFEANDKPPPQASCFPTDADPWAPMLDPCGPTTKTSPPCVAGKALSAECFEAPIGKNFCGMKPGPADMLVNATERAPFSSDCALGWEPVSGADARHAQTAMDGMAYTRGTVSEARFLDDLSSR